MPSLALDGKISSTHLDFFHTLNTKQDPYPWFQLEFKRPSLVEYVSIKNRMTGGYGKRFANVWVTVGNYPEVAGQLSQNPECGFFKGPSRDRALDRIECGKAMEGKYLTIQMKTAGDSETALQLNEVYVNGP